MFTRHSTGNKLITLVAIVIAIMVASCSSVRHVPADKYLLDKATVTIDDESSDIKAKSLHNYLRQVPNHKVLGFAKLQLGVYNMSGQDSTKWYNKWARRLGEEPVIYDPQLTEQSVRQLRQAMINKGYDRVLVEVDTVRNDAKHKMAVNYKITPGQPQILRNITYTVNDTAAQSIIFNDSASITL